MIIEDNNIDSREIELFDISIGQAFMIPSIHGYFMKINKSMASSRIDYCEALGVDIETGEVSKFNKKTKVIPVSVKCSISMNN